MPDALTSAVNDALADAADQLGVLIDEGIATVEFRRPDKHNAISFAMWHAFSRLMPVLGEADEVDVIVVRGSEGGPFSAGADIAEFKSMRSDPEGALRYGTVLEAGEQAIITCPKPTIAAIEGFAIGGGTQVAAACDLRICGESSRFGVTPAKLGIVYALASTARLVEVVGPSWARWILLTGELLDAQTALRIGLVHESVSDDAVLDRAYAVAALIASRAQVSLRGGKAMIDRVVAGQHEVDDDVRAIYMQSLTSAEYHEGVTAFLEKRPPDFHAARRSDQ